MKSRAVLLGLAVVAIGAGGLWAYERWGHDDEGDPERSRPEPIEAPEPDEPGATASLRECQVVESSAARGVRRLAPCDDGDPGMLRAMKRALRGARGPIAFLGERNDGDRRFGSLEPRIRAVSDPSVFDRTDSAEALRVLAEMGAEHVLVSQLDPPILPWLSPTATTIRELLRDAIPPPSFHPLVIGRAHVLYRVAPPLEISAGVRVALTKRVRARLAGEKAAPVSFSPPYTAVGRDGHRVFVSLRPPGGERSRGRAIVRGRGRAETLLASLDEAIDDVRESWDDADKRGLPDDLDEALPRVRVQIDVTYDAAEVTDRGLEGDRLFRMIHVGRDGLSLAKAGRFVALPPNEAIFRGIESEEALLQKVGSWGGEGEDAWKDRSYRLGRFSTKSWVERRPAGAVATLYRGLPLVTFPDVTKSRLVDSLRIGARFLVRNQNDDGQFRYLYKPFKARGTRWSNENNIVRHGLNPYTVLLVNAIEPDPSYVEAAKKGIGYTLRHLKRVGDRCYVWHLDDGSDVENAKMGTVAVSILSILKLGQVANIDEYRDELECFGNELLHMQMESGDVRQYDVPEDHSFHRSRNTIFPGEIMFAFSRLYEHTHDPRFRTAFDRLAAFQEAWWARLERQTTHDDIYDERHRVDLISFEPWGIMAIDDLYRQTGDDRWVDFAFRMVEFMDGRFQFDLARSQSPDYVGGYFKTQLELPAINSCGYSEGAAAAYAIALRSGRKIEERRLALVMGLRFALQLQYPHRDFLHHLSDPETALGGFRYNLGKSRVRNDYMYHAMSALAQGVVNLRPQDYPARTPIEGIPEVLAELRGESAGE